MAEEGAATASPTQASQVQPSQASQAQTSQAQSNSTSNSSQPLDQPSTSLGDSGQATRPRDARSLHLVLAAMGVTAYQERVPLQLLDFAYRYTSGILSDAQHLAAEGYMEPTAGKPGRARNAAVEEVGLPAIRMATASRLGYQFHGVLPKETMLELANERNRVRLPPVDRDVQFGLRLPHERFVLSGSGWTVPEEWDSEGDDEQKPKVNGEGHTAAADHEAEGKVEREDAEMEDDEGDGGFEAVFGEGDGNEDEDKMMDEG